MELKNDLFQLTEKRFAHIELLQGEIQHLEKRMKEIDYLIGINNVLDAESFLKQMQDEQIENIEETRTIFSPKKKDTVLVKMKYDGKKLEIIFPHPEIVKLKQQSSIYIEQVLQPLFPLKEKEKDLEVVVGGQNDLGLVTNLLINNLYKIENIDVIYQVFKELIDRVA